MKITNSYGKIKFTRIKVEVHIGLYITLYLMSNQQADLSISQKEKENFSKKRIKITDSYGIFKIGQKIDQYMA